MTDTVRKQRSGDQLTPGDWLAPDQISDGAAEVLYAVSYPGVGGTHVRLVGREQGKKVPFTDVLDGATLYDLASDEDLAELREAAERAEFVAGLREFAAWVEANPWAPIKRNSGYLANARVQIDLHAVNEDAGAAAVGRVREIAARLGVKVDESLNDRTDASAEIGSVSYSVIAWHKDGRPAESVPPATCVLHGHDCKAQQSGRPCSGLPVPAVPNDGRGDEARPGEVADQPAESKAWTHYRNGQAAETACGQLVADLPLDDGTSSDHAEVTCKACIDGLPF